MKIKQLLGMLALDANANEIGKIIDADFETDTGAITQVVISLKKNFISSNQLEVDFSDVKSIGDYVLLNIEVDREIAYEEAEKAKKAAKEAERAEREAEKEAKKAEKEAEKEAKKAEMEAKKAEKEAEFESKKEAFEEKIEEQKEVVEAELVEDDEEEKTDVKID